MINRYTTITLLLATTVMAPVILAQTQTVYARPKSNILTELGNAADAGKAAGIAAFKAGLSDT